MSEPHTERKIFILIDGHALIYRAYHAFLSLSTSQGELVNAVYGFARILLTVMRELDPQCMAVAFDHPKPTFRHAEYLGYKATRAEMPADLQSQIPIIKDLVTAFNIPQFELPGYEADDIIGTLTCQIADQDPKHEFLTVIVTGDRDAFQLVNDNVHVWMPGRGKDKGNIEYDAIKVKDKMGVTPAQIVDLKALMGDASDNIPGIRGVGEKTAVRLIQAFDTVEKLYQAVTNPDAAQLTPEQQALLTPKLVTKLAEGHQDAILSQQLAKIECNVPLTLDLAACRLAAYNKDEVTALFEKFEFHSLIRMLPADEFELGVQNALF